VGIPAFSISEGLKFKGHDLAWGEAQSKDYVEHRYHKPSDAFVESWDFSGDAKLASFGYALGQAAAMQSAEIKWLPGDEFEKAQKKLSSMEIDGEALFAGRPDLQLVQSSQFFYPPLARQTRISGPVVLRVTVGENGSVENIEVLKGHPLLKSAAEDSVKKLRFVAQASGKRIFDLTCEYSLPDQMAAYKGTHGGLVAGPLHILILAAPVIINTTEVVAKHG
jgi:TonB family protein